MMRRIAAATRLQAAARGRLARIFVLARLTSTEQQAAIDRIRSRHRSNKPGQTLAQYTVTAGLAQLGVESTPTAMVDDAKLPGKCDRRKLSSLPPKT